MNSINVKLNYSTVIVIQQKSCIVEGDHRMKSHFNSQTRLHIVIYILHLKQ